MKKVLVLSLSILLIAAFAVVPAFAEEAKPEGPPYKVGMMAKNVSATDADGAVVDLLTVGDKDKKVLMFTNTACSACKEALRIVQKNVAGKADLLVVATDFGPFERIAVYKEKNAFGGKWFQDAEFAVPALFDFGFTPAVAVLQKDGKVLLTHGGFNRRHAAKFEQAVANAVK